MDTQKLKEYWQKLFSWNDHDTDKLSINPARVWRILISLFLVGLVIVFSGLIFMRFQISRQEASIVADRGIVIEKIDEQKLKLILMNHTKRIEEFEKLKLTKPSVVDPGIQK